MSAPARAAARREIALLDADGLARIEAEWAELWHRCRASPFQHPAWLLPWARRYAPGRTFAAALRLDGRLDGLAPAFVWQGALLLAGTGPSDRGDWLLAPAAGEQAGALLAGMADLRPGGVDHMDLRQLSPASWLAAAPAPEGWVEHSCEDQACLVAPLAGEDGLGAASARCSANWRYAMRRIVREGGEVDLAPAGEAGSAMDEFARLHALRWRQRGESGVLADPLLDGLLHDAAPALARAGLLRLWRLRFGRETVAALLALAGHGTHAYYLSGFDPAWGRLGPSAALVGAAMAGARREGAAGFDFLRGDEPYKARWGARPHPMRRRILRHRDG